MPLGPICLQVHNALLLGDYHVWPIIPRPLVNGSGYHFFAGVPLASVHLALRAPTSFVLEDDMFGFPLVLAILFCQSTRFAIALSADLGGLLMLMFAGSGASLLLGLSREMTSTLHLQCCWAHWKMALEAASWLAYHFE